MPFAGLCAVTGHTKLAQGIYGLTLRAPALAPPALPGQFLHVRCGGASLLRRPISVCDVSGDEVTLVFEVKGDGTRWLSRRAPGDCVDVLGPLGHGFDMPAGRVIVVGGGIGAAPMLLAARSAPGGASAVLGFRGRGRVILREAFEEVCDKVYITTEDGSEGIRGAVTKPLEELLRGGGAGAVLACGPRVMLAAVAQLAEGYGVPCQVSLEERMGCGVGACLVCACATRRDGRGHMARVCKDGPVFDAGEVVW